MTCLKAATAWAFKTGLIGRDPLAGCRRPGAQSNNAAGAAWSAEEARRFLISVAEDQLVAARTPRILRLFTDSIKKLAAKFGER